MRCARLLSATLSTLTLATLLGGCAKLSAPYGGMAAMDSMAMPSPTSEQFEAPQFNTEAYAELTENDFIAVADDPLSTFSTDVDTASYSNTRRFLRDGALPPAAAVRIEELVNYFDYDYEAPQGPHPFSEIGRAHV